MEKVKSEITFGNEKIKSAFDKLKTLKTEEQKLHDWLERAFEDLENDAFSGVQIPKRLIPQEYETKFGKLHNLWKYNLPNAWRLIYTIKKDKVVVLSIILEWMTHKEYEKRFKY